MATSNLLLSSRDMDIILLLLLRWLEEPEENNLANTLGEDIFFGLTFDEYHYPHDTQKKVIGLSYSSTPSPLEDLSFFNFKKLDAEFLIENRHQNDQLQHKYDERFGLLSRY